MPSSGERRASAMAPLMAAALALAALVSANQLRPPCRMFCGFSHVGDLRVSVETEAIGVERE